LESCRTSSIGCRNPKTEISEIYAKNCGTLETLGQKIQNSQNYNLRVVEGALREVVHTYAIFSPNVSILSDGIAKKERVIRISRNLRRVVRFCIIETTISRSLCNGFFKTYALKPC
jgi:hypothetical protein